MKSQQENRMSSNEPPPPYQQRVPNTVQYKVQTGHPVDTINTNPTNSGISIISPGQMAGQPCIHPNLTLNYTYESCALACIILLCVIWFPLGLCSLFALDSAKNYKCHVCGHRQAGGSRTCIYVTFGILTAAAIAIYGVAIYYRVRAIQYYSTGSTQICSSWQRRLGECY